MAKQQQQSSPAANRPTPAPARPTATRRDSIFSAGKGEFIFGRINFILFGIGLLLVLSGLAAMSGGAQPDPNQWDESVIYSSRRITLAPMLMIAGFIVVIYGIFKSPGGNTESAA
jgi:predicted cobalt transporter CbtA